MLEQQLKKKGFRGKNHKNLSGLRGFKNANRHNYKLQLIVLAFIYVALG